jgi:septal ring factor EnvC (AmiA/AmiB activator)
MSGIPQLVSSLSADVRATGAAITRARAMIQQRQVETEQYYQAARNFLDSVRRTRRAFRPKLRETLRTIEEETQQLRALAADVDAITAELERIAQDMPKPRSATEYVKLLLRAVSCSLPLAVFAIVTCFAEE